MPRVTSMVFAPRNFCTTRRSPGPPLTTASPHSGMWSSRTVATSESRSTRPLRSTTGTWQSSFAPTIGCTLAMFRRCPLDSRNPPVPTMKLLVNLSTPASTASAEVCITFSSETPLALSFSGSTWTCCCWSRSPQMATCATPDTRSRRSRIFQ